jgi:lipoyl(octanoyl) transferase
VAEGEEDTLFLCEHPPTVTFGRHGGEGSLLLTPDEAERRGIALRKTARGGDATCHFPGQLVAYPVFRLDRRPGGVRAFVHDVEAIVISTLASFGVSAFRVEGLPGVWTERGKIASIGIGVKRWVSYHGLALNVARDVSLFETIVMCGIEGARPTSIALERGDDNVSMQDVTHELTRHFRKTFAHS